jgi:electron transfer flavoprotein alpha subunit
MSGTMAQSPSSSGAMDTPVVGVVEPNSAALASELMGDARRLADRLRGVVSVCAVAGGEVADEDWFAIGADRVTLLTDGGYGPNRRLAGIETWWRQAAGRALLFSTQGDDRALAARFAARNGLPLVAPALSISVCGVSLEVIGLDASGRRSRKALIEAGRPVVVAFRPGVAQPITLRRDSTGPITRLAVPTMDETIVLRKSLPADPATTDIRDLPRLVAGGRGLGGREGFDLLRRVADRLDAGVAASRMAVDLGWIDRERQVGQTGKTVRPDLYLAVGISGASHHRDGMAESRVVVALNNDSAAPIFSLAHLGLVSDWRATLTRFLELLGDDTSRSTPAISPVVSLDTDGTIQPRR